MQLLLRQICSFVCRPTASSIESCAFLVKRQRFIEGETSTTTVQIPRTPSTMRPTLQLRSPQVDATSILPTDTSASTKVIPSTLTSIWIGGTALWSTDITITPTPTETSSTTSSQVISATPAPVSTTSKHGPETKTLIGIVIPVVVVVAMALLLFRLYLRRRRPATASRRSAQAPRLEDKPELVGSTYDPFIAGPVKHKSELAPGQPRSVADSRFHPSAKHVELSSTDIFDDEPMSNSRAAFLTENSSVITRSDENPFGHSEWKGRRKTADRAAFPAICVEYTSRRRRKAQRDGIGSGLFGSRTWSNHNAEEGTGAGSCSRRFEARRCPWL